MTDGNAVLPISLLHPDDDRAARSAKVTAGSDVRELIPGGSSIRQRVSFGEDVWSLAGHDSWREKVGAQTNLDFTKVPNRWRDATKEWVLLCLNPSLGLEWAPDDPMAQTWPMSQEPIKLVTAQGNLKALRLALQVLDRYNLIEPDADGWARVATLMRQPVDRSDKLEHATLSSGTLRGRIQTLRPSGRFGPLSTAPRCWERNHLVTRRRRHSLVQEHVQSEISDALTRMSGFALGTSHGSSTTSPQTS